MSQGSPEFDEEQLRGMSQAERLRLLRALVALGRSDPVTYPVSGRRRRIVLAAIVACCVVLAAWIGVLAVTLPPYYRAGDWRGAWVGFDIALLIVFAATGWAAWRRRQILIACLVVLATLLCCDAWFDVVLDARTSGFVWSLLSAVCIELPLAAFALVSARRLLRTSVAVIRRYEGASEGESADEVSPRLRHAPLIGEPPGSTLTRPNRQAGQVRESPDP